MNDMIEFIAEITELHVLYKEGDLRNYDFETKLQKYNNKVDEYELEMEREFRQMELFV
jgi:hypothetical protein